MTVRALIAALGSTVMGDDGAGPTVLWMLAERHLPCKADTVELGTDIFRLRLHYDGHNPIILLDAIVGVEPGEVVVWNSSEILERTYMGAGHSHLLGIAQALELMRTADTRMADAEIYMVGIGAARIDKSMELSLPTKGALPRAAEAVVGILDRCCSNERRKRMKDGREDVRTRRDSNPGPPA